MSDNYDPPSSPDRPLVLVEWRDAQSHSGWRHEADLNPKYELPLAYSSGYLIQDTETYITLAQSAIFYEAVSNQINNLITIPRPWIGKITLLREGKAYVPKD